MKSKTKVLLVDDDRDFVEATKLVLESGGYEVVTAYDGDEGLARAKKEKPALIILDVIMPVKDGFTAAEKLENDPELTKIPVMMLTSFSQRVGETSVSVSQGMALDAEDYVEKPVSPQELLRRVQNLLSR